MPNQSLAYGVHQGGRQNEQTENASANGAIGITSGTVLITKGSAAALTLADPPTDSDGAVLKIVSTTTFAHTVTYTGGFGGAGAGADVANFTALNQSIILVAFGGTWFKAVLEGVTLS